MNTETLTENTQKTKRQTTPSVVYQMIDFLGTGETFYNSDILEPSAGSGHMLDILRQHPDLEIKKSTIMCCETNVEKRKTLKTIGYDVIGSDYLSTNVPIKADVVFACPPFKNGIDCLHIEKMYNDVKKGGKIITLCHSRWMTEGSERFVDFRGFLSNKKYKCKMLTEYSFIEKYKSVPTMILIIEK